MQTYNKYGMILSRASQTEKDAVAARVRSGEKRRESDARGWARLCGMAAPVGSPSGR